jgi:hypothetical protein
MGVVAGDSDVVGTKLLRPGAMARACRSSFFELGSPNPEATFREALDRLLAVDDEGNAVKNAQVREETFVSGIYNRRCVEIRGDVVRVISMIILPGHAHGDH